VFSTFERASAGHNERTVHHKTAVTTIDTKIIGSRFRFIAHLPFGKVASFRNETGHLVK
jgi:hypothetical protein